MFIDNSNDFQHKHYYRTSDYKLSRELSVLEVGFRSHPNGLRQTQKRNVYIFHYITKGKGYTSQGCFQKGDCYLVVPNEIEIIEADVREPYESYWIMFKGAEAKRILDILGLECRNYFFPFDKVDKCKEIIHKSLFEIEPKNIIEETSILQKTFFEILSEHLTNHSVKFTKSDTMVKNVVDYFENNYMKKIEISEIAEMFGYSRNHLSREFKKKYGMSPKEYLLALRIEKSKVLLDVGKSNIQEVALTVGFEDALYFSRYFSKKVGVTPSQYKNNNKNTEEV